MNFRRLGVGILLLFTLLGVGGTLAFSFDTAKSYAVISNPPTTGVNPPQFKVTMIDINHIWVQASGNMTVGDITVNLDSVAGMYYNGQAVVGAGPIQSRYIQNGLKHPTCYSDVVIATGGNTSPNTDNFLYNSTLTAHMDLSIDPSGTTANGCIDAGTQNIDVINTAFTDLSTTIGSGSDSIGFRYSAGIGLDENQNVQPGAPLYPSEVVFFQANPTEILSTQGDPNYDTVTPFTEFDETSSTSGIYKLTKVPSGTGMDAQATSACPDYITVGGDADPHTTEDDGVEAVTYTTRTGTTTSTCKDSTAWKALMLQNTPINTANGVTNAEGGTEGTGATQNQASDCPVNGWVMSWIACPFIEGTNATINKISSIVTKWLVTDVPGTFDFSTSGSGSNSYAYHSAWNTFRTLAISLVVIAGLVMVVSEAFGYDVVDAYTIRKVLPRLIIFAILIEVSWPGMRFIAQFSNNISAWIGDAMVLPFHSILPASLGVGQILDNWAAILAGAVVLGPMGVLGLLLSLLVSLLALYITLLLRYAILIATIIFMPIALAGMILPGTRRYAHLVVDEYFIVQVVIPLIFAVGLALAQIANIIISNLGQ
ncbi:MAG TPA: hypothetical protein VIM53_04435 [Candidatus Saccharimonadales bacterium]